MKTMITVITTLCACLLLISFSSFATKMLSPVTVIDSSLLPKIKFLSVKQADDKNIIGWQAEKDLPDVYYEVERSEDSVHFNTVAMILGPKPTTDLQNYFEFKDKPVKQKIKMYYRIRQINAAGEIYYTGIIKSVNTD